MSEKPSIERADGALLRLGQAAAAFGAWAAGFMVWPTCPAPLGTGGVPQSCGTDARLLGHSGQLAIDSGNREGDQVLDGNSLAARVPWERRPRAAGRLRL